MLRCKFVVEFWHEILAPWGDNFTLPNSIPKLFSSWRFKYPGGSPKNNNFEAIWLSLPKFTYWKIWLERNSRTFRDKEHKAKTIIVKIKSQLKKSLDGYLEAKNLSQNDKDWSNMMGFTISTNLRQNKTKENWQIRLNEKDFSEWLIKHSSFFLFFDGAANGNFGKAGAGGVIKNIEGRVVHSFA